MTITNKLKTIAKTQINNIIQRIPVSDLRSILASRGVLIFESERESHLHSLSVLHNKLDRHFGAYDVENWHADEFDQSAFEFDAYLTASLNLVDDLWIPGEEPPAVDAQRNLESAVQAWNAQHDTELLTIDESELSELQDKALKWDSKDEDCPDCKTLNGEIEMLCQLWYSDVDAEEHNDMRRQRDALKKELAFTEERLGHAVDYQGKLISDAIGYADKCGDLEQERDVLKVQKKLLQEEVDALKRIIDTERMRQGHLHDQIEKLEQDFDAEQNFHIACQAQLADRSLVIEELSHKIETLSDYLDEAKYEHNRVGVCLDEARSLCSFDPLLTHR